MATSRKRQPSKKKEVARDRAKEEAMKAAAQIAGRPLGYSKRPKDHDDFKIFEDLCKIQCTPAEMMVVFDCSKQTLYDHVKAYYGEDFPTVYDLKKGAGKISLRRSQFRKALEGNTTMLIWLGKQYLGQGDVAIKDDESGRKIIFQSRIGPGGNLLQEIKTGDDWDKSKTMDVRHLLVEVQSTAEQPPKTEEPGDDGRGSSQGNSALQE